MTVVSDCIDARVANDTGYVRHKQDCQRYFQKVMPIVIAKSNAITDTDTKYETHWQYFDGHTVLSICLSLSNKVFAIQIKGTTKL